jgi:hypothetical protein
MNHLHNAIRKCQYSFDGRILDGCLVPKEILALRDFGVAISQHDIRTAVYRKRNGINNGSWTCFEVPRSIEEQFKTLRHGLQ